jgi:hypothetical protein
MAGENTEGTGEVEMTGAGDGLPVNETVDALADSLHLSEGGEIEAKAPPEGGEGETQVQDDQAAAPSAVGAEAPATAPTDSTQASTGAESQAAERVPDTWRPEAKAKWATVDPVVRAEITKREGDVAKFVAEVSPSFNIAKAFTQTVEPYLPMLQRYGVDAIQHIQGLLQAHTQLLFGEPHVKARMVSLLAQQAGVDLAALAADPNAAAQADMQQLNYVRAVEQRLARMENGVSSVTSTIQGAREAELQQGIMAFASDPQHPFFWELAEQGEIKALIDTGAARTLKDAYELAVYRNPTTRSKQIALEAKAAAEAAATKNAVKAQAARRATGANVRSRNSGRIPPGEESIDDTLRSTLSDIHSRH